MKKSLEADDDLQDLLEDSFDPDDFGPDALAADIKKLEACLSEGDSQLFYKIMSAIAPRLDAIERGQQELSKALKSRRPLSKSWHLDAVVEAEPAPSARAVTLAKSLGVHGQRMGYLLKAWFGPSGGFSKAYDKQTALRLRASGELTALEMERWRKFGRLPDKCRLSA